MVTPVFILQAIPTCNIWPLNLVHHICLICLCIYSDPLESNIYMVKLGFTGIIHYFLLFLLKNIDCGHSLEPPWQGCSNEYQQSMFWAEIWKISEFLSENFQFWVVKFSLYLNSFCNAFVLVKCWSSMDLTQCKVGGGGGEREEGGGRGEVGWDFFPMPCISFHYIYRKELFLW